ncbi:MAG: hypothetical protein Q9187_009581, partial [Circinaria calcarea]
NKTSSAVQLKHLPSGIVIKSQATRSRTQNRKIARRLLAEKLEVLEKGPESRVAVKGEIRRKKKASKSKKAKRKYRGMAGEAGEAKDGDGVVEKEGEVGDVGDLEEIDYENGCRTVAEGKEGYQPALDAAKDENPRATGDADEENQKGKR